MSPLIFLVAILLIGVVLISLITAAQKPTARRGGSRGRTNRVGGVDREFVARKWQTIELMVSGGGSLRDAVFEADTLVDYALKQSGFRGETMGERLKSSGSHFSDINAIWSAHKLRNALAHEAEFDLVPSQAKEAVQSFKRGLHDLRAL